MLRVAFVDNVQAAKDFSSGDVVRRTDFRGFFPSPYAGRVDYVDYRNGTVQVQWPWGNSQELPTELIRDASGDFKPPVNLDQGYSTWERSRYLNDANIQKTDEKWRKELATRVSSRYEESTKPIWRVACKLHHDGIGEILAFQKLSAEFGEQFGQDAVKLTVANLYEAGRHIPMHLALYWKDRGRQYKVTQQEKKVGKFKCPGCGGWNVKPRTYRHNKKVLNCRDCGFSISPKDLLWDNAMSNVPAPISTISSDRRQAIINIFKIANGLSDHQSSLKLRQAANNLYNRLASEDQTAVINPGVMTWQQTVEEMVDTLKDLDVELGKALDDFETSDEFAKFFEKGISAEEDAIREILERIKYLGKKKIASSHIAAEDETAGFGEFWKGVKNKFKKPEGDATLDNSYALPDKAIDEFVKGSRSWLDASEYVEKEYQENKAFFDGAASVLTEMDKMREEPTRNGITALKKRVMDLIKAGQKAVTGARKHFDMPADTSSKAPNTDDTDFEFTVQHHLEMMKEALNDPKKLKEHLLELFRDVGPMLKTASSNQKMVILEVRKRVASALLKTAQTRPQTRPFILPILKEIAGSRFASNRIAIIRKEKGKYCVRSPKNPDWNGGCYNTKGEAKDRLKQVEMFKHMK